MSGLTIDLNADMGEGYGAFTVGQDDALVAIVTSANVACGFHAGDPTIMAHLAQLTAKYGVGLGAHPGFNDLLGFGRRAIEMSAEDLEYQVAYQIGALSGIAAYGGQSMRHVKPHGMLYNMAAKRAAYARAIVNAVKTVDPALILVGLPNSEVEKFASEAGLTYAKEGFCDRLYQDDGTLMPRSEPGSVFHDAARAAAQALRLVEKGEVVTASGKVIKQKIDTLCIHGDEPNACKTAETVRQVLENAGIKVAPMLSENTVGKVNRQIHPTTAAFLLN